MAGLLPWIGKRIQDLENGVGGFVNGAVHNVEQGIGGAVNNVAHTIAPQPPRQPVIPQQTYARMSPQARQRISNADASTMNSARNVFNPGAIAGDVLKASSDFGKNLAAGLQQGAGRIGDITLEANGVSNAVTNQLNPFISQAQRDQNIQNNLDHIVQARNLIHGLKDINGQNLGGVSGADQSGANIAAGRGNIQDAANVGGTGLQVGLDATTFANPGKAFVAGAAGKLGFKPVIGQVLKEAGLYGGTTAAASGAQSYGQTGDPLEALKSAAVNGAIAATGQAVLGGGGYALGRAGHVATPAIKEGAQTVADTANSMRPSIMAANDPRVAGFNDHINQLQQTFDQTANPVARQQINKAIAEARLQQSMTHQQVLREMSQAGFMKIPNKDELMGSKPAQFFFGDKKPVQKATQNNMAARQMANTETNQPMNLPQDQVAIAPDMQPQAGKVVEQPVLPDTATSTLPQNHQASSPAPELQKTLPPSESVTPSATGSPSDLRTRGFIETIKNDVNTPQKVKDSVSSLYQVRNTKELQTKAANLVKDSPDTARRVLENNNGDVSAMVGSELIKHLQNAGNFEEAINVAHTVAKQATEHGRASQALSAYAKITPEGILRFAQKEIGKFNEANKLIGDKARKLSTEDAQNLVDQSTAIQKMPEGREKDIATQKMLNDIQSLLPAGWVKKMSTLQTMGQLLNPKTAIRNILGNSIFGGLENVSQVAAAGIDKAASTIRKSDRTTALPNIGTQAKAIGKYGKEAAQEIHQGVNLGPDTQFELNQVPVFKNAFMKSLENAMSYELRVPDRAAYGAAFDDTVKGLMKANHLTKPTQEILDQAHANGLYKTFQDNSKAAELFSGLKGALNHVGLEKNGQRWGLGDLILKYPKTPGNIIARGLDYSPAGVMKGLYQIVKPAITKQPFDQHTFANSIARGTVGTGGLIGAGAVLGGLGIITEKPSSDTDTRNLQKSSGQGGYQINTSALLRFFGSGLNKDAAKIQPGDTLVSYDWAQPLSIPLSAGAAIGKGQNAIDGATSTIENLASGLNTLVEQPLISGVNTFANNIKNKGVIGALGETAKSAPASFVPTASNQVRQLTDNTSRSTYDPNATNMAANQVINKIPFADRLLLPQVDTLGKDKQNFQNGSNNIFNVAFNPAFITKYAPEAAAKLPLDILARSGETQQMPHTTKTSQKVNGANVQLTPQQNHDFQQYVGQHTKDLFTQFTKDPVFMAKSDTDKAKIMSAKLTDITKAAKIAVLGDTGKATKNQLAIANGTNTYSNSTGSTKLASNLSAPSKDILSKYDSLDSAGRMKLFSTQNDAEYKYTLAKYENDKANKTLTPAQDIKAQKTLRSQKIGAQFDKNVRDLYGISKSDLASYLATPEKGVDKKKLANDLFAYDKALYESGASSTMKYKYGIASSGKGGKRVSKGGKGRKSGGSKKGSASGLVAGRSLVNLTKSMNHIHVPKTTGTKAPSSKLTQPKLAKTTLKTYKVAKVKSSKRTVALA